MTHHISFLATTFSGQLTRSEDRKNEQANHQFLVQTIIYKICKKWVLYITYIRGTVEAKIQITGLTRERGERGYNVPLFYNLIKSRNIEMNRFAGPCEC